MERVSGNVVKSVLIVASIIFLTIYTWQKKLVVLLALLNIGLLGMIAVG